MTALLEATGLSLPRRLFGVSLTLAAGELVCLVGPNGSGKTSLLHALAGIGGPAGHVRIGGVDPRTLAPGRRLRQLGFLPAGRELLWPLKARDLIALGGATDAEVADIVARLELAAVADRRVDRLSTGERSRVLIARVLAPQPRLLLLDEPTANLDPLWQIRLMEMLKTRLAETGQSALVAIHDLDAAARYAGRILIMDEGRLAAEGLDRSRVATIFGIERVDGEWRPAFTLPEDRRSSP